ncbi:MAG: argininosuccinate synthase [Vicinamibacterales bacterium]
MAERIVLAYSGGLDTSVAIRWLAEQYQAEVVAVTLDLGQGKPLDAMRDRALAAGAVRCHVLDVREELARDYVLPALKANALYEERYPMATALGRPLIAKKLVEIAHIERAVAVAHGATGRDNDQIRLEVLVSSIDASLRVVAPARLRGLSRADKIAYAIEHGIPVRATPGSPYSVDSNLWGRSITGGVLVDPWQEAPEEIYALTKSPADTPMQPAYVEMAFERGLPAAINGVPMSFTEIVESLTTIAGAHSVGRIDMVENRLVGVKLREIYEAPAAVVLHMAHKELESFVMSTALHRFKQQVATQYADIVYNGLWFTPFREALDAFVERVQERVTGTIRLKLFKGDCHVVGRQSPFALDDRVAAVDNTDEPVPVR